MKSAPACRRRRAGLTGLVFAASLLFITVADAATVSIESGPKLVVTAAPGEYNNLVVSATATDLVIDEYGGDGHGNPIGLTAGSGCTSSNTDEVACPLASLAGASGQVDLGDGDDVLHYDSSTVGVLTGRQITVDAGDGNDEVDDSPGNDTVTGGAGSDMLAGGGGSDTLNGGDGSDSLYDDGGWSSVPQDNGVTPDSPATPDTLNGGAGDDYIWAGYVPDGADSYDGGAGGETSGDYIDYYNRGSGALRVDLTGATTSGAGAEGDSLAGIEGAGAGAGPATMIGTDGPNVLNGSPMADTIHGGGGADEIWGDSGADSAYGDAGDDSLYMQDGSADSAIDCGDGSDFAALDDADPTPVGCESTDPPRGSGDLGGGSGDGGGGSGGGPIPVTTTTPPPVTTPPAPPTVFDPTAGLAAGQLLVAKKQQSPDLSAEGSTVVKSDGSAVDVKELYAGKLAKVSVIARTTVKNAKAGIFSWKLKLNKKAARALKRKKSLKVTIKSTVTPPNGKPVVRTMKVTLKRGKKLGGRCASVWAHAAC